MRWKKPNIHRPFKSVLVYSLHLFSQHTNLCLVWLPFAVFFLAAAVFRKSPTITLRFHLRLLDPWLMYSPSIVSETVVIIAPFLRPSNHVGDTPPLPYYLSVKPFFFPLYHLSNAFFFFSIPFSSLNNQLTDIASLGLLLWSLVSFIGQFGMWFYQGYSSTSWYRIRWF